MISLRDIAQRRLVASWLAPAVTASPADVARHLLAAQGQDFFGCLWALGARSGATLEQVEEAFNDGSVVRSWPMRGTLHVVASEDVGWMQELTSAAVTGASAARRRAQLGLAMTTIERAREVAVEVLRGGRALSRDALLDEVTARGVELRKDWRYHLTWYLAQTGTLVYGPIADGEHLLVLVGEWIRSPRRLGREEALAEIAGRYVTSHGPATETDLARWTGLGLGDVRTGLRLAGAKVTAETGEDGQTYWLAAGENTGTGAALRPTDPASALRAPFDRAEQDTGTAVRPTDTASVSDKGKHTHRSTKQGSSILLLPAFDEHMLGYADRSATLDAAYAPRVCPGGNGMFKPIVVVEGVIAGTWQGIARGALRQRTAGAPIPVTVTPFDATYAALLDETPLKKAADSYARFLGRRGAHVTVVE